MNLPLALHTAARAFCASQHLRWSAEYMPLVESGNNRLGKDYSKTAYSLFPRYRLDEAIEREVERATGQQFGSLDEVHKFLLDAGSRSLSSLLEEFQRSPDARLALIDEWKAFEGYINSLDAVQLAHIEPLPYRRVLTQSESEHMRHELSTRWGVKGYWYPLAECNAHTNVVAFHQELWERRNGASLLLQAMQQSDVERCFLLQEGPVDYEIGQSLVDPIYRGDECFMTSDFEWLLYSSHESSITVAGWLADFFRAKWPDWKDVTYGGPFHTSNLRGTWETPRE